MADLEPTERGQRLTLAHSKGSQTQAVTVPLPYGDTELCPVRALERWLATSGITEGQVFRRIWLPKQAAARQPLPSPALVPSRSRLNPWRLLCRPVLSLPALGGASSAAIASSGVR